MTCPPDASSHPAAYDPFSPSTLLILVEGQRNRELLKSALGPSGNILFGPEHLRNDQTSLIIVDQSHIRSYRTAIRSMRNTSAQVFLPVLLLVRSPVSGSADLDTAAWNIIDEILPIPVRRRQLKLRVEMLLQARRYSQVSAQRYQQLQKELDALQQLRKGFQQLFAASRDPVVLISDTGTILRANPAANDLLRMDADQLIGQSFDSFFEEREVVTNLFTRLQEESWVEEVKTTMRRADGSSANVDISAGIHGKQTRREEMIFQFIIRDISA